MFAAQPPNILWIIGDDLGVHASTYGTAAVNTPHMDSLAAEGVKFSNAFVTAPVCSAMRSALMTGMYQTSIGAHHHRTSTKQPLPSGVEFLTKFFRDEGYYVSNGNRNQNGNGKNDYNFDFSFNSSYDGNDWRDRPDPNMPFFSQVQIYSPHRSFEGANTDPNRVNNLDLPSYYPDHELSRKDYADYLADVEDFDAGVGNILNRLENDGLADNTIVMIFGDHGAPHVRDKQWLYDGGIRVPLIVRDPTGTLYQPGQEGTTDDRMISHIDISATSIELAGGTVPGYMEGVSFADPNYGGREAVFAAKDRLDGVVDRVRSVQVGNMKLIRNFDPNTPYMLGAIKESAYKHKSYPMHTLMKVMHGRGLLTPGQANFLTENRPEYELYDLSADPEELVNLADDPNYASTLADLQQRINQWMIDTGDMGGNFDPDAVSAYNSMRNTLQNTLTDRVAPDATDYEYLEWWANKYDVELNLPQTDPDPEQVRLPNKSWDNTSLGNGEWDSGTPQGWTESSSTVVQNLTASQMASQSHDGANILLINSDDGETRWALDDNWGNLVQFEDAIGWEIELGLWVGRRSDGQGDDPGVLEVSIQNTAGDKLLTETFSLASVSQGAFAEQTFTLRITDSVAAAAGSGEQLYLALGNIVDIPGSTNNKDGRIVLDDMSMSITEFLPGDFDADWDVDSADFMAWQRGESPNPFSSSDLFDWEQNFGAFLTPPGNPGGQLALPVPEPSCSLLLVAAAQWLWIRPLRRR